MNEEHDSNRRMIGRRRFLRRAGGVAAGVAGATVVGAAPASPAFAAPGGNMILGEANDAGTAATGLTTNNGNVSTLELANSALTTGTTFDTTGAQLRLVPPSVGPRPQVISTAEVGSLGVTSDGTLWLVAEQGFADWVYTTFTANQIVPITPTRILDTRSASGRASILDPAGNIDGSGRLLGGHAININLSSLVNFGTVVHANLTIVFPQGIGFASLLPGGQPIVGQPSTSNVNFVLNDVVPNFALCGIGAALGSNDVVKIYSSHTTHVLLDVFALTVNSPAQVNPAVLAQAAAANATGVNATKSRAEQARTSTPSWAK